jgi:tetratricopeptide (TPR) repeat protein
MAASISRRERRIKRTIRTAVAMAVVVSAIWLADVEAQLRIFGIVVLVLLVLRFAIPGGWENQARRAAVVVPALTLVVTLGSPQLSAWVPIGLVFVLAPLPALLAMTSTIWFDDLSVADRAVLLWGVWARARSPLRVVTAVAVWLLSSASGQDGMAALLLFPAAVAVAAGHPIAALAAVGFSWPWAGTSTVWVATGLLATVATLGRLRVRPPRRSVALPVGFGPHAHPMRRARIWWIDRSLSRSDWRTAELRAARFPSEPEALFGSAALRLARARLEQNDLQGVHDALGPALRGPSPTLRAAALRLRGEALRLGLQPDEAIEALRLALDADPGDEDHRSRAALAMAEALTQAGRPAEALAEAERAAATLRGRRNLVERFRATRLIALAAWKLDDLSRAIEATDDALGISLSVRWLRQYLFWRDDQELVFRSGAVLLAEWMRLQVLEVRLKSDPRYTPSENEPERDVLDDLEMYSAVFDISGADLDRSEVDLLRAEMLAAQKRADEALNAALAAISDLDRVRHALRTQTDRAAWSAAVNRALTLAIRLASDLGKSAIVAELIELARVQAIPMSSGIAQGEVALNAPPTVRVRGNARLVRGFASGTSGGVPPIDLERAAASAVGDGGWWLSFWDDGSALTWSLVPPSGSIFQGRIQGAEGEELSAALAELNRNLPVALDGDRDPADIDVRLHQAAFRRSPEREAELSARLGRLLLPERLRKEALDRYRRGDPPLRLAIAPAPRLGRVPWALLVVELQTKGPGAVRVVECVEWSLAPSATLLVATGRRARRSSKMPLRVAVLDTADVPPLPAARSLASRLPGLTVLGGRHWDADPATVNAVWRALSEAGPESSVLFGCHAVQGDEKRPSDSALLLAPDDPADRYARLSATALFDSPLDVDQFPAQVSLQACDTSDLASSAAGEWLSLAPAFLVAGARTVGTTQFPLVDVAADGESFLNALIAGSDLAEALREEQLAGLARWRSLNPSSLPPLEDMPPPLEDTPLAWAAHAVCSTGRASDWREAPPLTRVPASFVSFLDRCAKPVRERGGGIMTSAHIISEYLLSDTELITGTFAREVGGELLLELIPRVLQLRPGPGRSVGLHPSEELLGAVRRAAQVAASTTGFLEREHIVQAIAEGPPSPGRMLLSVMRLRSSLQLRQTLRSTLRERTAPSHIAGQPPDDLRALVDRIAAIAEAPAEAEDWVPSDPHPRLGTAG